MDQCIAILNMRNIQVENARLLEEAAILNAEMNVDFTDAYLTCFTRARGMKDV